MTDVQIQLAVFFFGRAALEAKAALYEKLSRGEDLPSSDDDEGEGMENGPRYMVDFHRKTYEKVWLCVCVCAILVCTGGSCNVA